VDRLRNNLLSVTQLCDADLSVFFHKSDSHVLDSFGKRICDISRIGNVFQADFSSAQSSLRCLISQSSSKLWKWHRRLGHLSFDLLCRLSGLGLLRGLSLLKFESDLICTPCRHGKMITSSHSPVNTVMTEHPGQLLHMDPVGPSRVRSMGGKWYVLFIVDDYSHYSWLFFLESKDEVFEHFRSLALRLNNEHHLNHSIDFLLVQIYVDDIIFGGSSHTLVSRFQEMMESEIQMSMMGELTFFLGIQVKRMKQGTFVHQAKYTKDLMKKFNMAELKPVSTPMSSTVLLGPDEDYNIPPSNPCNNVFAMLQSGIESNSIRIQFKFSSNSNSKLKFNFYLNMVDLWPKCPIQKLWKIFKSLPMQICKFFWGPQVFLLFLFSPVNLFNWKRI
jgi:hypothetical protein